MSVAIGSGETVAITRWGPIANRDARPGTAFAFGLMILPVAAFLYQTGRPASADRERRLAALRLAQARCTFHP